MVYLIQPRFNTSHSRSTSLKLCRYVLSPLLFTIYTLPLRWYNEGIQIKLLMTICWWQWINFLATIWIHHHTQTCRKWGFFFKSGWIHCWPVIRLLHQIYCLACAIPRSIVNISPLQLCDILYELYVSGGRYDSRYIYLIQDITQLY